MKNKIILSLLLVCALAMPIFAKAITVDDLKAQIVSLQARITQLLAQLAQMQGGATAPWCHSFNTNLGMGSTGAEVNALHSVLSKEVITGDFGWSSDNFDEQTASYIVAFQEKYASDILSPLSLKHGTGYVGKSTRAKLNKLYGCGVQPVSCLQEGEEGIPTAALWKPCCLGLVSIGKSSDYDASCNLTPDAKIANRLGGICTACGNGVCGKGENSCNCPSDCKTTATTTKSISVVSPNGGEQWIFGVPNSITWISNAIDKVSVYLWFLDGGMCKLTDTQANLGKYTVTLQENQQCPSISKTITAGQYKISVWEANSDKDIAALHDASDNYFTIVSSNVSVPTLNVSLDATTPPSFSIGQANITFARIKLTASSLNVNNFNAIQVGSDSTNASDYLTNIRVFDGATQIGTAAMSLTSNGSYYYSWISVSGINIPAYGSKVLSVVADMKSQVSGQIRLGITGLNFNYPGTSVTGLPIYGFTMTPINASISVVSPNGGEKIEFGKYFDVAWSSSRVKIVNVYVRFHDGIACKIGSSGVSADGNGKVPFKIDENSVCLTDDNQVKKFIAGDQYMIWLLTDIVNLTDTSDQFFSFFTP